MGKKNREFLYRIAYKHEVEHKSLRQIGEEEDPPLSKDTISRRLKNAKDEGIIAEILNQQTFLQPLSEFEEPEEMRISHRGEVAAKVFRLLENGYTVPKIVIRLRTAPEIVEELYNKWVELKKKDVNQPNLEMLDRKLQDHIWDHYELDDLLEQANDIGGNRRGCCKHVNSDGLCEFWTEPNGEKVEREVPSLRCAFCNDFEEWANIIEVED